MKIAILYVCTGLYTVFWDDFFKSAERYFLPGLERHYFVFTDSPIETFSQPHITVIHQEHLGWPNATLKRYHIFSGILEQLQNYNFIYFLNANCEFKKTVSTEMLPSQDEGLLVVQHPGFFNKSAPEFTYERDFRSKAYIPSTQGTVYVCGGVNGGRTQDFCKLIAAIKEAVDTDEKMGVTALWHDESHLNKYILDKNYRLLSPAYCFPEGWDIPFDEIIRIRDKKNYGGHGFLRGQAGQQGGVAFFQRIKNKIIRHIPWLHKEL